MVFGVEGLGVSFVCYDSDAVELTFAFEKIRICGDGQF
jgi:hypothetical protein